MKLPEGYRLIAERQTTGGDNLTLLLLYIEEERDFTVAYRIVGKEDKVIGVSGRFRNILDARKVFLEHLHYRVAITSDTPKFGELTLSDLVFTEDGKCVKNRYGFEVITKELCVGKE